MSDELVSAIQFFLRAVIIGAFMALVSVLGIVSAGINKELGTFIIDWNVALATFVAEMIIVIKNAIPGAIDRYLHKSGIKTPLDMEGLDQLRDSK